jgi:hypothetical protein
MSENEAPRDPDDRNRDADIGTRTAEGHDPDIGGSTSGGDADDINAPGGGEIVMDGDVDLDLEDPKAQAERANMPPEVPDDLKPGKRKALAVDEDEGAGTADITGVPGSTTGGE